MINKKKCGFVLGMLVTATMLSACSLVGSGKNSYSLRNNEAVEAPTIGGVVTYGYSSPFKGLFEPAFYEGEDDFHVLEFITESMFTVQDDLSIAPNIATWQVSGDHTTFVFKIKPGVRWHNGDELTVEDWKFAIETIASPDYTGSRYYSVEMIQGVEAYHDGKAKGISGLKVIDPYTLKVTVTAARVNTLNNLWSYPMNKKYFNGIDVKDMPESDQVRKQPIGIGPFEVVGIQPGESVMMKRFDDYYDGKALLDGVLYKVFDDKKITDNFDQGEIDIQGAPRDAYESLNNLDHVKVHQTDELAYEYIGFKFGKWDSEAEKIIMNNNKFTDKRLRQAMYYALDREGIINEFSYGLGKLIETPLPEVSWAKIPDSEINTYRYDPEKAKSLLNEAGYIDVDGDGLREDSNGHKLVIHYDSMTGSQMAELRTASILEDWQDVGLDVRLNGGQLKEMNVLYDAVEADDPSIELFHGVWGLSSDPDPTGLWREDDLWNYPRWSSERNEELIRDGISMKSFDRKYRKSVYYEWQKLVNEEVPMIFFAERENITAVNKRLQGVRVNTISNIIDPKNWWIKE